MHIQVDDFSGPEVIEFPEEHLRNMYEWSPPESVHALDLAGLKVPEVTFWTIWENGALMGRGALKVCETPHLLRFRPAGSRRIAGLGSRTIAEGKPDSSAETRRRLRRKALAMVSDMRMVDCVVSAELTRGDVVEPGSAYEAILHKVRAIGFGKLSRHGYTDS